MKTENLLDFVNKKTCNDFVFLKLKQVSYDRAKNYCLVNLIYPQNREVKEDDKEKIKSIVWEYINLDCQLDVKINKSFVEPDLIKRAIFFFLENNNPAFFNSFEKNNLQVFINAYKVDIQFSLDDRLNDYYLKYNLDKMLIQFLNKNFCASFEIRTKSLLTNNFQEDFLNERLESLKAESEVNALLSQTDNKYVVVDKKVIVGKEISFNPRYITSIKQPLENCVVAGKINFLTERTYKSKRLQKNKSGEKEQVIKPYFSFVLKDDFGSINAVIFPSKKNYHKMNLLKNGDSVLVNGNIERFNDKLEILIKDVSLCQTPDRSEIISTYLPSDYRFIKPIKYNSFKQSNLFDRQFELSPKILQNNFVIYDFETSGLDILNHEIIEIGALKIKNGVFSEIFTCLVKPKRPIPAEATKINHITNEMVENCFSVEQVIPDFYLFCKDCDLVGYNNIAFDNQFLFKAGKSVNLNFKNRQIDVMNLAKEKLKGLKNYKLSTVLKALNITLVDAHRALNDVVATAEAFLKLFS